MHNFLLLALANLVNGASASVDGVPFENPQSIKSSDKVLRTTIDLDWLTLQLGSKIDNPIQTRAIGGSIPGPTIRVSPGDTLMVNFNNKLTSQESSVKSKPNFYSDPDVGNLHFHGGHVSSVLPGDDTTLAIPPQASFDYTINFPEDHLPGIHWIHPHHHGSTTLHLAGGAAMVLIVEDPKDSSYLPPEIDGAEEKVMVFQYWNMNALYETAKKAGDKLMTDSLENANIDFRMSAFFTVNGLECPTIDIAQGEWQRWRILYAGWLDAALDWFFQDEDGAFKSGCEMQLLAKDGIYIQDFPRRVKKLPIPPGGRADVMIRCSKVGKTFVKTLSRTSMIINVQEEASNISANMTALSDWAPLWPSYLTNLQTATISEGCSCETNMDGYGFEQSFVNMQVYKGGNHFLHTSYLGATIERKMKGTINGHSYHQHVYPFQIDSFEEDTLEFPYEPYFKMGDWHDTWMDTTQAEEGEFILRYQTTVFPGKIMVHCHNSQHADSGMLAKEYVRDLPVDYTGAKCECEVHGEISAVGTVDDLNPGLHDPNGSFDRWSSIHHYIFLGVTLLVSIAHL